MKNEIVTYLAIGSAAILVSGSCWAGGDCHSASGQSDCTDDVYDNDCQTQTFSVSCEGGGATGQQTVVRCGVGPSYPANRKTSFETGGTCVENDDPDSSCTIEVFPCYYLEPMECVQEAPESCSVTVTVGISQWVVGTVGGTSTVGLTTCSRLPSDIAEYGPDTDTAVDGTTITPI